MSRTQIERPGPDTARAIPTLLAGFLIAALPAAAQGVADQPPLLTLERAIEIALDGNRELRAADARVEAAAAGAEEAEIRARIDSLLGHYTVRYQVSVSSP